jgi:hypothetical protein
LSAIRKIDSSVISHLRPSASLGGEIFRSYATPKALAGQPYERKRHDQASRMIQVLECDRRVPVVDRRAAPAYRSGKLGQFVLECA